MAYTAYLPIVCDRYGAMVRHLFVVGLDLSGVVMRAQVRLSGDTPGEPLIDLLTVTNGNAEGLRLVDVTVDAAGVPTSHVEIVINELTLEAMPYAGELGDAAQFAWDMQITLAGRKRRLAKGEFEITGDGVTGAEVADRDRVQGYGRPRQPIHNIWSAARMTFGEEQVTVQIEGVDLLAPFTRQARDAVVVATARAADAGEYRQDAAESAEAAGLYAATALTASTIQPSVAAGLAATPEGGFFTVAGTGDAVASLYRKVSGAAVFQNDVPSVSSLVKSSDLAAYIARFRPVLRRFHANSPLAPALRIAVLANGTISRCRQVTTDGTETPVYVPDGNLSYRAMWIRDASMAAMQAPQKFLAADLEKMFIWYLSKCTLTPGATRVPDHVKLDGTPVATPGEAGNWGSRASTDGEPYMVGLCWAACTKSGNYALFTANKATLKAFLDNLPYDPATQCLVVPAGNEWTTDGFKDTVKLNGCVAQGTNFIITAYRQLAEMAFDSGDYAIALICANRAEEISAGLSTPSGHLWVGEFYPDTGEVGLLRASTGNLSPNVGDVPASLYAVAFETVRPDFRMAIAQNLARNLSQWWARGGVRHALTSQDYQPGVSVWQAAMTNSGGLPRFGKYQNGSYWPTWTHLALYAINLVRPDLATQMARGVMAEIATQDRINRAGYNLLLAEWVDAAAPEHNPSDNELYGVFDYMTSAAALVAAHEIAGAGVGASVMLYADAPQTIQPGLAFFTQLLFARIERDDIGAAYFSYTRNGDGSIAQANGLPVVTASAYEAQLSTPLIISAHAYFPASPASPIVPGAVDLRVMRDRGGVIATVKVISQKTVMSTNSWDIGGMVTVGDVQPLDRFYLAIAIQNGATNEVAAPAVATTFFHVTTSG